MHASETETIFVIHNVSLRASRSEKQENPLKKSTQWDLVCIFALFMTFVSFFIFMFGSDPLFRVNLLLIGLGNLLLIVIFLLFSFMSFVFAYLEGKREDQGRYRSV